MKNSRKELKLFLLIGVFVFCIGLSAIYAEVGEGTRNEQVDETSLIKGPSDALPIRKFQAEERRTFFKQLSEARKKLAHEWDEKEHQLKEQQRLAREEARPKLATVEERREFLTRQRHEMTEFKHSRRQARRELIAQQKLEVRELLEKQKKERRR